MSLLDMRWPPPGSQYIATADDVAAVVADNDNGGYYPPPPDWLTRFVDINFSFKTRSVVGDVSTV